MCLSKFQGSPPATSPNSENICCEWDIFDSLRRFGSKQRRTRHQRCTEGGFAALGAAFALLTFIIGVGVFLILHQVGTKVQTQIEMDRFTGNIAIQLRSALITVEKSKERLRIAHEAMIAGCIAIPACPGLQRAYRLQKTVEHGIQQMAEVHWNEQKLAWMTYKPLSTSKNSIPYFSRSTLPQKVRLKLALGSLISTAEVWSIPQGVMTHEWKVAWIQ